MAKYTCIHLYIYIYTHKIYTMVVCLNCYKCKFLNQSELWNTQENYYTFKLWKLLKFTCKYYIFGVKILVDNFWLAFGRMFQRKWRWFGCEDTQTNQNRTWTTLRDAACSQIWLAAFNETSLRQSLWHSHVLHRQNTWLGVAFKLMAFSCHHLLASLPLYPEVVKTWAKCR